MDTRRGSNHNNKGKHSRYTEDNDEEEKNKRSRANNSNLAGGNAVRSINMEPEKQTQDVAMHPLDLATNKESSLRSVAEKSALVFEDPLNNSPTHNIFPKMSDDNNNNISEPSNNGNNDNISESLAAMDQGEESDSPAPPAAAAANAPSDKDGNSPASSNNNLARVPTAGVTWLPQQEVPSCDKEHVAKLFHAAFPVDKWYDSADALHNAVVDFGNKNYFTVRKEGTRSLKCSRAPNTNSRKKEAKEKTVTTKEFAVASDCPVEVRFTLRRKDNGRVKISFVNGLHNHPLNVSSAAISQRLAGRDINMLATPPLHPNLTVAKSRAFEILFTKIRDRETSSSDFVHYSKRAMRLLAEEAAAHLPTSPQAVTTPTNAVYKGHLSILDTNPEDVCAVSIVRAGDSLLECVREIAPSVRVGKMWIQRNESSADKEAVHSCTKLPKGVDEMHVLLLDPMLATGGSACAALNTLIKEYGVAEENIVFANVISCPEGLAFLAQHYPRIKVVTCWIDDCLNEDKFIVPGLGDYGDRFFNTV